MSCISGENPEIIKKGPQPCRRRIPTGKIADTVSLMRSRGLPRGLRRGKPLFEAVHVAGRLLNYINYQIKVKQNRNLC